MVNFDAINEILKNYYGGSFFYGKDIPDKKLRNALYSYVPGSPQIFALYDATIFGSAKEGACFTQDSIHYKSGSTIRTIKYDEILSATIVDDRINGTYCSVFTWCPGLIESIKKVNDPVDLTEAKKSMSDGSYAKAIRALDKQEKYVRNTPVDDVIVYKYMYIEAYLGLKDYNKAEQLLKDFIKQYRNNSKATALATDANNQIVTYREQYIRDLKALKKIVEECEVLRSENNFDEAIEKLMAVELREDFADDVKLDYYKCLIETYLLAEKPDDAEATINELYKKKIIDSNQKTALDKQVYELRETLHRRFIQEQRELITKRIEMAKMYEKYEIYESASDTILAALSNAPTELNVERVNLIKMLADMLMSQYEYDELYAIGKQYSDVTSSNALGYSLSERIEEHKAAHEEEYFDHLYSGLLYYMQNGKLERAQRYLNNAKKIKSTFDLRCSEVNLAILKHDYVESRNLIDSLRADRSMYDDDAFDEAIGQLEEQYKSMIAAISDMLKAYVLANNTEALLANHGYSEFVDKDGLNLSCIAARFANHGILDLLEETGCGYEFRRTNEGFGIAVLAAMQMDYDVFAKFINARMDSYDGGINCVLNERMDYGFGVSKVVHELRTSRGLSEQEARKIATEAAFNEIIFFIASLLDEATREDIIGRLTARKQVQENKVVLMKKALPDQLQRIDAETNAQCDSLKAATSGMKALLADVPEDETNAELVMGELQDAVSSIVEFAKENAEKKKSALKSALVVEENFVDTIQSRLDIFTAIDVTEVISLMAVPAAAIQVQEYSNDTHSMEFTMMGQHTTIELSPELATAISSNSDRLQINQDLDFVFDNNTLTVKYGYTYSDGTDSCSVVFEKAVTISSSFTADKLAERILGACSY